MSDGQRINSPEFLESAKDKTFVALSLLRQVLFSLRDVAGET